MRTVQDCNCPGTVIVRGLCPGTVIGRGMSLNHSDIVPKIRWLRNLGRTWDSVLYTRVCYNTVHYSAVQNSTAWYCSSRALSLSRILITARRSRRCRSGRIIREKKVLYLQYNTVKSIRTVIITLQCTVHIAHIALHPCFYSLCNGISSSMWIIFSILCM